MLRACHPAEAFSVIRDGRPLPPRAAGGEGIPRLGRAIERWRARLGRVPADSLLADWERAGIRLACPGDPEWPTQLDVLGDARPLVLWLQGCADLRFACLRSVSIVGTRAATGYGRHVCAELAASLAERGWAVVSGGAFGIDGWAHRGALSAEGITIAVLPSGLDDPYPRGHHELFQAIAAHDLPVWIHPIRGPNFPDFSAETVSEDEIWFTFGWPYETSAAVTRLIYSGIYDELPNLKDPTMISAGHALFLEKQCAHCHGEDGAGGVNLTRRVLDAKGVFVSIADGREKNGIRMPAWRRRGRRAAPLGLS